LLTVSFGGGVQITWHARHLSSSVSSVALAISLLCDAESEPLRESGDGELGEDVVDDLGESVGNGVDIILPDQVGRRLGRYRERLLARVGEGPLYEIHDMPPVRQLAAQLRVLHLLTVGLFFGQTRTLGIQVELVSGRTREGTA
jgi:hypothetical protein